MAVFRLFLCPFGGLLTCNSAISQRPGPWERPGSEVAIFRQCARKRRVSWTQPTFQLNRGFSIWKNENNDQTVLNKLIFTFYHIKRETGRGITKSISLVTMRSINTRSGWNHIWLVNRLHQAYTSGALKHIHLRRSRPQPFVDEWNHRSPLSHEVP